MEENRYKIEKIEKLNKDINRKKYTTIIHAITSASYALYAVWLSIYSMSLSSAIGISFGGLFGTLSIIELINGTKKRKEMIELSKIKDELMNDNNSYEEEVNWRSK